MATHTRPRIAAAPRSRVGRKSELRSLRRDGLVPASLFGHGEPEMIRVPAKLLDEYLLHHAPGGLMDLELEGRTTTAVIREVQRHPVSRRILNIGFQRVDLAETIRATLPLEFIGEDELVRNGLILQRQAAEVEVHGRADQLPESIVVDVTQAVAGTTIRIADLGLAEGITPTKDADQPVATISTPSVPEDMAAALDAEEAAHAALAGEAAEVEGEATGEPAAA